MKIGIFTDSHFSSAKLTCGNRHNSEALERIGKALQFFSSEKCDLIVCLGDLIDKETAHSIEIENLRKISVLLSECEIPLYVLMGNHDGFAFEVEEFYSILGEKYRPKNCHCATKKFVFLDACYFKNGQHYMPGDTDWTDCFLPDENALREELANATEDTYVFIHQSIDPAIMANHRIFNADKVFEIVNESGVVKAVFQGHYHPGCNSEYNGVKYITLPALCEQGHGFSVYDI